MRLPEVTTDGIGADISRCAAESGVQVSTQKVK
jgi:hypothetical protein